MKPKLIITGDGSHSLYAEELDEHYHSMFGALTESQHIFIESGLRATDRDSINILEIGFGTGLNALLTLIETMANGKNVYYTGLEKYPLDRSILDSLNYPSLIKGEGKEELFHLLHDSRWNKPCKITDGFIIEKKEIDIQTFKASAQFDLVYFDAFGPDKQPELWTTEIFFNIYKILNQGAVLTTYSSKGQVRRNMKEAGFRVEKIPGPPGKRHMTRAWKD